MKILKIYTPLQSPSELYEWVATDGGKEINCGHSILGQIPSAGFETHVILPAKDLVLSSIKLPKGKMTEKSLAYALEDQTAQSPENIRVIQISYSAGKTYLAIVDKSALCKLEESLEKANIKNYYLFCETFLLPLSPEKWSISWNGIDGFIRAGEYEGQVTDVGSKVCPPFVLSRMVKVANTAKLPPTEIHVFPTSDNAIPDVASWHEALGIPLKLRSTFTWRDAITKKANAISEKKESSFTKQLVSLFRPAVYIALVFLTFNLAASCVDLLRLKSESHAIRVQMEKEFLSLYPGTSSIVDPALQMRRKLAQERSKVGELDPGDFLPLIDRVGSALKALPTRLVSKFQYDDKVLVIYLKTKDQTVLTKIKKLFSDRGLQVTERRPSPSNRTEETVLRVRSE